MHSKKFDGQRAPDLSARPAARARCPARRRPAGLAATAFAAAALVAALIMTGCPSGGGGDGLTVAYAANGATGGWVPVDTNRYDAGETVTIKQDAGNLVKGAAPLICWTTEADGTGAFYWPGDTLKITASLTLYARFLGAGERLFNALRTTDNTYYRTCGPLVVDDTHCQVYVEIGSGVTQAVAQTVAAEYDAHIHNQIIGAFGAVKDVDGNGKVILLLLDIRDGYDGTGGYIAGYFDPTHMFSASTYSASNEADMLFLDVDPSVPGDPEFNLTVAHELQHLISFSQTYLDEGDTSKRTEQDLWINEGLSSGAEYVYSGSPSQERIDWYNADQLGSIAYGNNFFVWDGYFENENPNTVLDNYATVSLFFQWLRIHGGGTGIYKVILDSQERDFQAVVNATTARFSPAISSWEVLLESWHLANILYEESGPYGYANAFDAITTGYTFGMPRAPAELQGEDWPFSPGEGIASEITGDTFTPSASGSHIHYVGITTASGGLDTTGPYEGDVALVFNANSDNGGTEEWGHVASVASGDSVSPLKSAAAARVRARTSWKVDLPMRMGAGIPATVRAQLKQGSRGLATPSAGTWSKK